MLKRIWVALFTLLTMVLLTWFNQCFAISKEEKTTHGIWLGPAIYAQCKQIHLLTPPVHNPTDIAVSNSQSKFQTVRDWVVANLWPNINVCPSLLYPTEQDYKLILLAEPTEPNLVSGILLEVPLTADTLGPDYQAKIAELQRIMSDSARK